MDSTNAYGRRYLTCESVATWRLEGTGPEEAQTGYSLFTVLDLSYHLWKPISNWSYRWLGVRYNRTEHARLYSFTIIIKGLLSSFFLLTRGEFLEKLNDHFFFNECQKEGKGSTTQPAPRLTMPRRLLLEKVITKQPKRRLQNTQLRLHLRRRWRHWGYVVDL